jgi:hypothetical protein
MSRAARLYTFNVLHTHAPLYPNRDWDAVCWYIAENYIGPASQFEYVAFFKSRREGVADATIRWRAYSFLDAINSAFHELDTYQELYNVNLLIPASPMWVGFLLDVKLRIGEDYASQDQ